jgi:hypothetical protein
MFIACGRVSYRWKRRTFDNFNHATTFERLACILVAMYVLRQVVSRSYRLMSEHECDLIELRWTSHHVVWSGPPPQEIVVHWMKVVRRYQLDSVYWSSSLVLCQKQLLTPNSLSSLFCAACTWRTTSFVNALQPYIQTRGHVDIHDDWLFIAVQSQFPCQEDPCRRKLRTGLSFK